MSHNDHEELATSVARRTTEQVQGNSQLELFADDFVDHTATGCHTNKNSVRVLYRVPREACPDFRPEIHSQAVDRARSVRQLMRDALNADGELRHAKTCPSSLWPVDYIVEFDTGLLSGSHLPDSVRSGRVASEPTCGVAPMHCHVHAISEIGLLRRASDTSHARAAVLLKSAFWATEWES